MNTNLTSPSQVRELMAEMDFKPSRVLGQNFLIDSNIINILIREALPEDGEPVIEVGPGLGVLTEALLNAGATVTAVEKDHRLAEHLRGRLGSNEAFTLIEGDALDVDWAEMLTAGSKLVSNLPYSVGNRILVDAMQCSRPPEHIVVMVQQDVAHRFVSVDSCKTYGVLAVYSQFDYEVKIAKEVSPRCFMPQPQIWSSILRFRRRSKPLVELTDRAHFYSLVKWAFTQRRKQLKTLLRKAPSRHNLNGEEELAKAFEEIGLRLDARPENLTPLQWGLLSNALNT